MPKQTYEQLNVFYEDDPELKERGERLNFKIGIFGGSSDKQSAEWAERLAGDLTKKWHPVITGGYAKGVMGTALEGAEKAIEEMKKDPRETKYFPYIEPRPMGVVMDKIMLEHAKTGKHIDTNIVDDFFARKKELITTPSAFIIFEGGIGTGAEITDAIVHNMKIAKEQKPIIFVGAGNTKYEQLLTLFKSDIVGDETKENIYFVKTLDEANKIIEIIYQLKTNPQELDEDKKKFLNQFRLFKENKE